MAPKDREQYNAYMRQYMLDRYRRRQKLAWELLGGKCVVCGATDNLQLDHKERSSKEFTICKKIVSVSEAKLEEELLKCQLLCVRHHQDKTYEELGFKRAKGVHGTVSSYRYCRCELCVQAHSDRCKEYRDRKFPDRKPIVPAVHGSPSMYSYHKCRCDICKQANAARMRKYRDSK